MSTARRPLDIDELKTESATFTAELATLPWYEQPTHLAIERDGAIVTVFPAAEDADGNPVPGRRDALQGGGADIDLGGEFRFPWGRYSDICRIRTVLILDAAWG